jgi:hypothetical protein
MAPKSQWKGESESESSWLTVISFHVPPTATKTQHRQHFVHRNAAKATTQIMTTISKNISIRAEWLSRSRRTPSEPSETLRWQNNPRTATIARVALHIALWSVLHQFFSLFRSSIINEQCGVVGNSDRTSEWVHWVRACIGIAMQWVTLQKSLLVFLLPARKMQFSLY